MPRIYKGNEVTMKLLVHKCVFGEISDLKIALYTTNPDNAIEFTDRYTIDGNIATLIVPNYAFGTMEDGVINYVAQGIKDGEPFCTNRQSNYFLKTPTDYVPTPMPDEIKIQIMKEATFTKTEESRLIQPDFGYDGMKMVVVHTEILEETKFNEGYEQGYEQGKVEGGESVDCSEAYDEGYLQGKNDGYESGYAEGYNQGQADCPESGECPEINLEDKWITPSYNEKDDNGLIVVNPSEGFDGMNRVVLDPQQIYNEGVEEGRNQGGGGESGGDAELGVLDVVLENPWTEVYDAKERDGLDGYSVVNIRPEELVERERNNAVEDFKNKMDSITITENGSYGIDHLITYPYLDYENVNGYAEFHYTPNDDNFEIEVSYSLGSDPAVMYLVDIGEYSVVLEAGTCVAAKNDERISPEHMPWGDENKTIHTIKVTREGINLLDDGSFISWGEDLGTISSNIKVGRDFTSKVFTVKINGETFTPEGDGVFTNSFAIGEAARYGELQISEYPNGFRNVEVNVPSVRDVITQYRYNPITVGDLASGLRGDLLNIGWSGMICENDDWVYDSLLLRGTFKNNNHRIYTTQKVKSIENDFIFTEGREYIQNIVFDDNISSITLSDVELPQLNEIVFGEVVLYLRFNNCNFHSLEKIVIKRNAPLSQTAFNLENTTVAENGILYVPEGYENADSILSSLPSGWTTQYI